MKGAKESKMAASKTVKIETEAFNRIQRGDRVFVAPLFGQPRHLVKALAEHTEQNAALFADVRFCESALPALAPRLQDYAPVPLFKLASLIESGRILVDVALVQVSPPDANGFCSLGINVDITRAAMEAASVVVAQVNPRMPRVHGDTFVNTKSLDYLIEHEEVLPQVSSPKLDELDLQIGRNVAQIIENGDTLQIGYGAIASAVLKSITHKKHLGLHSQVISDCMIELIREGVIDGSRKSRDRGKSVASCCVGSQELYGFIDDNPNIALHPIDYTNNPGVIGSMAAMTAVNVAGRIDLTGQAISKPAKDTVLSGLDSSVDFVRATALTKDGKSILALRSTDENEELSSIVPVLKEEIGAWLDRSDIQYVVTEHGVAYLHGKNFQERAMALIAIAHPKFRPWLIKKAKKSNLIDRDLSFIPGKRGEYPNHLESLRSTEKGVSIMLRPLRISDDAKVEGFFSSLADHSIRKLFMSMRRDSLEKPRKDFVLIDYSTEMVILACLGSGDREKVVAIGQFIKDPVTYTAELAFAVRDSFQNVGIGSELLSRLLSLAKNEGLQGFSARVPLENRSMIRVFEKLFPDLEKRLEENALHMIMPFG